MQELRRHPKRPDDLRIEQLQEAWDEGALHAALQVRGPLADGTDDFDTACAMQPPALFNKDPVFEKSAFIPGTETADPSRRDRCLTWLVVPVLWSCQSPIWIWLVNCLHLHTLRG